MESYLQKGISTNVGTKVSLKIVKGSSTIIVINRFSDGNFSLQPRVEATAPAACSLGFPRSILYRESTLMTWKLTMKIMGPIPIANSI